MIAGRGVANGLWAGVSLVIGVFLILAELLIVRIISFDVYQIILISMINLVIYALFITAISKKERLELKKDCPGKAIKEIVKSPINIIEKIKLEDLKKDLDYEFIGSTKNKKYHRKDCKLCNAIDEKFKVANSDESFFKKNKFKACRICIKKVKS